MGIIRELLPDVSLECNDQDAIEWATEIVKNVYYGTGVPAREIIQHFCLLVRFRKTGRLPEEALREG